MGAAARSQIVESLAGAFGAARDVSADDQQTLQVLLPKLELPEPWSPSPTRALTIWSNWPRERPRFFIDVAVVGESGQPPRSNSSEYHFGEAWRAFSFAFPWSGADAVRAVQMWMTRFVRERS